MTDAVLVCGGCVVLCAVLIAIAARDFEPSERERSLLAQLDALSDVRSTAQEILAVRSLAESATPTSERDAARAEYVAALIESRRAEGHEPSMRDERPDETRKVRLR